MRTMRLVLSVLCMFFGLPWMAVPAIAQECLNGPVVAMTVFDEGPGPALYVGGPFIMGGGVGVAKWDGKGWSLLGGGLNGVALALTTFEDGSGPRLYAGGDFPNGIAKWDGRQWLPLGSGLNGRVSALTVFDDGSGRALYAGGLFTMAGGEPANSIAKWDGMRWSPLGSGVDDTVNALTVFQEGKNPPALYVGGRFDFAGGELIPKIARWDGTLWSSLGSGPGIFGWVFALTVFDDGTGPALYAGGQGGNSIAKWDGTAWSPLGSGMNDIVFALTPSDEVTLRPYLYAGGGFTRAGGVEANFIARWDGTAWSPLDIGMDGPVGALKVSDQGLYAGGGFTMAGGVPAHYIARWDTRWSPLAVQGCDTVP